MAALANQSALDYAAVTCLSPEPYPAYSLPFACTLFAAHSPIIALIPPAHPLCICHVVENRLNKWRVVLKGVYTSRSKH